MREDFSQRMDAWVLSLKATNHPDAQKRIWQQRPDAMASATKMWQKIQPQLAQEWTLDYSGWLLKLVCSQPIDPKRQDLLELRKSMIDQIIRSIDEKHFLSTKLAPICIGLVAVGDQPSLKLLEKIESKNANSRVQGVAAVCISHLLGNLSDSPEIMQKRLTLLRKSIIQSHDVVVDGVTMAKLAEDQLYVIQHLSKGRQAPEIVGVDQTGVTRKLSAYKGKVVMLLFWAETMHDPEKFIEISRALKSKYNPTQLEILGVFHGATASLRALHAENIVNWTNLTDVDGKLSQTYRISAHPMACVLDQKGAIQFIGSPGSFAELTADALLPQP